MGLIDAFRRRIDRLGVRTAFLALLALVLPWQTRFMFGEVALAGGHTEYGVVCVYATQIIFVLGWIALGVARGPIFRPRIRQEAIIPLALFALAVLLSLLRADEMRVALTAAFHFAVAIMFAVALCDERVTLRSILVAFALGLLPPVLLGLWQTFSSGSPASTVFGLASRDAQRAGDAIWSFGGERVLRAYGSFSHPNIFGGALVVGLVSWLSLMRHSAAPWRWGVAAVLLVGLLATGSRAALLAAMIGVATLALARRVTPRVTKVFAWSAAGCVVVVSWIMLVFAAGSVAALRGGGEFETRSLDERVTQLGEARDVALHADAIVGVGLGTYVFALERVLPGNPSWFYQPVHVVPILVFIEVGLLGFIACVWLVATLARRSGYVLGTALLAPFVAIAFFDHYLWTSWSGAVMAALIFALCAKASSSAFSSQP